MADSARSRLLPLRDNLPYVEAMYARFRADPRSVSDDWRAYFRSLDDDHGARPAAQVRQERVDELVRAYRVRGHLAARIDPLDRPRPDHPELQPAYYGLSAGDLELPVSSQFIPGLHLETAGEVIEHLRATYCDCVAVQFMHIDDLECREWLRERMESSRNRSSLDPDEQRRIFTKLSDATLLEDAIHHAYTGAKRFSLEGEEGLIPALDVLIRCARNEGVREVVLAMTHRGRLNVLTNILGKSARAIFEEFEDAYDRRHEGAGDVKYHLGYSADPEAYPGVHLTLCFNPSHLEFVTPVALGRARAKQTRANRRAPDEVLPVILHGDAAFAGEGILAEALNMSDLPAYTTGGAIHIVINNQIGFTTPPDEARSSTYPTDVAKLLHSPIFHVNAEEPEAIVHVVRLCVDFRARFGRDAFIDLVGYRRYGHNEGDEPSFTQPAMTRRIHELPPVRERYLERLLKLGDLDAREAEEIVAHRQQELDRALQEARAEEGRVVHVDGWLRGAWAGYRGGPARDADHPKTAVAEDALRELLRATSEVPGSFEPHEKVERFMRRARAQAEAEGPIDWATAERLAFATLLLDGVPIRLTGQDSARGTFSQRHAVLHDVRDDTPYVPLQHLGADQAAFEVANSPLNEAASLAFEYGYSLDRPETLVLWEAQFGDFINAAQVIVDQFIASGEDKWRRLSGLTLLLPHGFEGQGPEHSSARLDRMLALCAEDNMQVVYPTTPAQYFHLLRRQGWRAWKKPLIVLTPKSLLRHPAATDPLSALASGRFAPLIPDPETLPERAERVLLCSGKVYYDLRRALEERQLDGVYIGRVEELYPLPRQALLDLDRRIPDGVPVIWVQEEPENMGAWRFLISSLRGTRLEQRLRGVMRPASASPATGSRSAHEHEKNRLLVEALTVGARPGARGGDTTSSPSATSGASDTPSSRSATSGA